MEKKLRMTREQVLEQATQAVRFARNLCGDIEFSPEDGYRSDMDFLARVVEAVIREGAGTINIPDTVGYGIPELYGEFIKTLRSKVPNSDKAIWSVHCHNDLGMAVANSLAGVKIGGARQIECTDQRPRRARGQRSLEEEVVMAVRTRRDYFGLEVGIDTTQIVPACAWWSQTTGFVVQPNKAVVGANAFAHASGIHQDGVLKARDTYEIMRAEDVGWAPTRSCWASSRPQCLQAAPAGVGHRTRLRDRSQRRLRALQGPGRPQGRDLDEDIIALVMDESVTAEVEHYRLLSLSQRSETGERRTPRSASPSAPRSTAPRATAMGPWTRRSRPSSPSRSRGRVAAVLGQRHHFGQYRVAGRGHRRLRRHAGRVVNGVGADPDIVVASAKAYLRR